MWQQNTHTEFTNRVSTESKTLQLFGGKKVYTKGAFISENSTGKKRFGVYQEACFQGKMKNIFIDTPKSLQGVCGGPLRAALVHRFWPPNCMHKVPILIRSGPTIASQNRADL